MGGRRSCGLRGIRRRTRRPSGQRCLPPRTLLARGKVKSCRTELKRPERRRCRTRRRCRVAWHLVCRGRRGTPEVGPLGWSVVGLAWISLAWCLLSVWRSPWVGGGRRLQALVALRSSSFWSRVLNWSPCDRTPAPCTRAQTCTCIPWTCVMGVRLS